MSRQRTKGTAYETLVLSGVQQYLPDAHRLGLQGAKDCGDIWTPASFPLALECKNYSDYAGKLAGWLREAEIEAGHAGKPFGAVIHKRRLSTDPFNQFCTITLRTLLELACG